MMRTPKPFPDPANARAILDEADIGSGEKTAAQEETEAMIREIPPLPSSGEREPHEQDETDTSDDSSAFDAGEERGRQEHDASLERDEPSEQLDDLDPVPPEGH